MRLFIVLLFFAVLTYIYGWIFYNFAEIYNSVLYKIGLNKLYKSIKITTTCIQLTTCVDVKEVGSKEYNELINMAKTKMAGLNKSYTEIMTRICKEPTKFKSIYNPQYLKCVKYAGKLKNLYCENFAHYY